MDWTHGWLWSSDLLEIDSNWTQPFLKSVFNSFNDSLVGTHRAEKFSGLPIFNSLSNLEQCVIAIPILLIIMINKYFSNRDVKGKNKFTLWWPQFVNPKTAFIFASFLIFSLLLPVIILTLILCYINRLVINFILKKKHGNNFIKLLDGTDTIWALEEDNAKSIINVITTVEVGCKINQRTNGILLKKLKEKIAQNFFTGKCAHPKMFYKRSFEKGYYFWEKHDDLNIDDYVRSMDMPLDLPMNNENLHKYVSKNANSDLPFDNTASWEVLISERPMEKSFDDNSNVEVYPLLFRIHHSLGDGVVLMKLLLKTIADEKIKIHERRRFKNTIKYIICLLNLRKMRGGFKLQDIIDFVFNIARIVMIIILAPASLMSQVLRPPDSNILHGPLLTGKKVCAWVSDGLTEESLLLKIKRMKSRIPGVTFSDVFLTALSASYHNYFTQCCLLGKPTIPEYMTAVVPVRVEKSDLTLKAEIRHSKLELENRFSVAMLTIPITQGNSGDNKTYSLLKRLVEVRKQTSQLRSSADYCVNYWIMSVASHVLPESILRPVLYSEQATLVVSNLPGPTDLKICGGNVRNMAFFVPNRGTTGMGVTLLTCGGKVHLGLMADSALISCTEDAESILKGAVEEIKALDVYTTRRMNSQQTSMEIHST